MTEHPLNTRCWDTALNNITDETLQPEGSEALSKDAGQSNKAEGLGLCCWTYPKWTWIGLPMSIAVLPWLFRVGQKGSMMERRTQGARETQHPATAPHDTSVHMSRSQIFQLLREGFWKKKKGCLKTLQFQQKVWSRNQGTGSATWALPTTLTFTWLALAVTHTHTHTHTHKTLPQSENTEVTCFRSCLSSQYYRMSAGGLLGPQNPGKIV